MKPKWIVAAMVVVALCIGVWCFVWPKNNISGDIACTQDAMQCPDGSYVGRTGPNCEFQCPNAPPAVSSTTVDTSVWKTFSSATDGVSFRYPSDWNINGALGTSTVLRIGHPLSGMTVYMMTVSLKDNPQNLSAQAFVAQMLADDAAEDIRNGAPHISPPVTPLFDRQFNLMVNGYPAYELYRVFRFDEHTEQIYVQWGSNMIVFEFPVAETNPNLNEPVANNAIVHQIVDTFQLDPVVGRFCGGIAAGQFQCPSGYSCQLDGNYPDAGGHCIKN